MAGMLACARLRFIPSCVIRVRNNGSLRWWKGDPVSSRSIGVLTVLPPYGWQAPSSHVARPRELGVLAPSRCPPVQKPGTESTNQYRLIYRFPWIRHCRVLSRAKLLQTAFTFLILPPIWVLYWQSRVTLEQCYYSTGIACFAAVMLYGMSFYLRRIIGMMYLNEDGTMLKVAHLTFWGKRRDMYCPVETVMTLGDSGEDSNELLLPFKQYDIDHFLYFSLRFGQIVDREGFARVFGELQ
ncbi:transmembrane protein 186 [Rhineura floridana]|uniref:transmembrane protein 186 n=1 Tax=Rhineura floridana TaxID=261503 RepID=UPI002AC831C1|nr:transmembrane protein 186 [Rhineura floridana]